MSTPIKFGINLPTFPIDMTWGSSFTDQLHATLEATQDGFSSAWITDHFYPWASFQDPSTDTHECWTMIAYFSGVFPKLKFGSIVLSQSYRSPALLAKMSATLQTLTHGRLVLGIGAGWKEDEYLAYGYDYPPTATRINQLEEAVQIIRLMWSESKATFRGQFYHIEDAICEPKPDPPIPLLIGGGGKKLTLRIVAKYADWWNFPGGTPQNYADLLSVLNKHCEAVGRNFESIRKTWSVDCVAIASSHEAALEIARSSPFYDPPTSLVGTPQEVAEQLRRFIDLGVSIFIFRFADFPRLEGQRRFAEEVISLFR